MRWRKEYEARGEAAFTEKQLSQVEALEQKIAELERFCGQLSLENQILKVAGEKFIEGVYHEKRPRTSLGYLTPVEFEAI